MKKHFIAIFLLAVICVSCGSDSNTKTSKKSVKGKFIYRKQNDSFFFIEELTQAERPAYPWEKTFESPFPVITKSHFRCKGHLTHPFKNIQKDNQTLRIYDCGGFEKHSLPLRNNQEFIYPILIDLLNYVQNQTQNRVVITSGHCCPDHLTYLDPAKPQNFSKHAIGAEVDFYVEKMEKEPEKILELLFKFYREKERYQGQKEFQEFKQFDKDDGKSSLIPWLNKEIFIRIYKKNEGRDYDNQHSYPYISIQVRYDYDLQERVQYSWDQAFKNYYRY